MPKITFPDGRTQNYEEGITGQEIAKSISKSLLKEAIAISVNGVQQDLCDSIDKDASISLITLNTDEGLEIMTEKIPPEGSGHDSHLTFASRRNFRR